MQKALLFQCKTALDAPPETPPREANNFALRLPNAVIYNESSTFAKEKNKMKKEDTNIKLVFEKVCLTPLSHFRLPRGGLLEKMVPEAL